MAVFELYSKRQKKLNGDLPDVYTYDDIPGTLRVQIIHIWGDALGNGSEYRSRSLKVKETYKFIVDTLCREYGQFRLVNSTHGRTRDYRIELRTFLNSEASHEKVLDAIELAFVAIDKLTRRREYKRSGYFIKVADDAIKELNHRFKEHGVGYQFEEGKIVRVDSELIHSEVVKPALKILRGSHFEGAQQEFLTAHKHYRKGDYKETLNECLKAFESTMKAICDKNGWSYNPTDTSKKLIKVCLDNGLIPPFWQNQINHLNEMLISGVPTARNKLGGHGQGSTPTDVPGEVVSYVLHMTASTIVFLGDSEAALIK